MKVEIRELKQLDYNAVRLIYEQGIKTKNATFEITAPSWDEWNKEHLEVCRFVACINNEVIGWIALSRLSRREVYRGVCQVSVYVSAEHSGKGIGRKLFERLIKASDENGI